MELFFTFTPLFIFMWYMLDSTSCPKDNFWYKHVFALAVWGLLLFTWLLPDRKVEEVKVHTITLEDQTSMKGYFTHKGNFHPVPNNVVSVQVTYPRWGSMEDINYETVTKN